MLNNIQAIKVSIPEEVTLIVVTKTFPPKMILEAYNAGHKIFGESRVQELLEKYEALPDDIEWHLIGHLQTNKVKHIAPFVKLIHSVDSLKLLQEINKEGLKNNRVIDCLLQIYIAREKTKFGLDQKEAEDLLFSEEFKKLPGLRIIGFMGMATNTDDLEQVRIEFRSLKKFFDKLRNKNHNIQILSMGMSSDYRIAVEEGSNMIRIGSAIFAKNSP
ncbi:MAG: YggS family pyridoxal phosphate-dependent enzyme [Candidatus Methanoperedens sp.]|nr:YggS family pyridoxal phosphate-dependent enzyme [Candidatus Methanoperedens sp.]